MKVLPHLYVVVILFYSFTSYALPKYSLQERKRCYECHFNQKGGGPLNEKGRYFDHYRTLRGFVESVSKTPEKSPIWVAKKEKKEETTTKESVPKEKETSLLDKTELSAVLRLAHIVNENRKGPNNFYFMQAEPLVTTQVSKDFLTVFGYNFAAPLLTAYGQFHWQHSYLQLGSFHLPFGIDTYDYNNTVATLIKERYDLTLDTRDIGVEMGYESDWFIRAAIVNGAREPRERPTLLPSFDRNLGYVLNMGYEGIAFKVPFLFGTSVLYERRIPPGDIVRGKPPHSISFDKKGVGLLNLYGQLQAGAFSLLGEFTYGRHSPLPGDRSFGFYLRPSYNILDNLIVAFRGELFSRDRKYLRDNWSRYVFSAEYNFSKYASIEPMLRINNESGVVPEIRDNEFITLVHMRF